MGDANLTMRSERMKAHARIRDLENELAEARAQIRNIDYAYGKVQARHDRLVAQIAARQAERDEAWTQLAQARKERDDAEAQIIAKDVRLAAWAEYAGTYFMIDDARAYMHLVRIVRRGETAAKGDRDE